MKSIRITLNAYISIFFAATSFAAPYFQPTRMDAFVPSNCRNVDIRNFNTLERIITYSVDGSRGSGFTNQYPITSQDAQKLWKVLRTEVLRNTHKLTGDVAALYNIGRQMGFNFDKEGDVLEALALIALKQEYPEREYFLTGGLAYGNAPGPSIGEIDIIAARRSDCAVVAIGEAKLGVNERGHAVQQLNRFVSFLKEQLCSRGEQASVCR